MVAFFNVGKGTHTYQFQAYKEGCASECLFGWGDSTNNFLLVEEIEMNYLAVDGVIPYASAF